MDSTMDQYRTAPDTLGGRYMRLFWHPVYRLEELKPGWAKPIAGGAGYSLGFDAPSPCR